MEQFTRARKSCRAILPGNLGGGIGRNYVRRQFVGANSGRNRIGTVAGISSDACLAEHNSKQAWTQQHEAGRRQGKKSVGDNVVVAHETPTTSDARPNLLKLSESPVETTESFLSETGGYPTASRSKLKLWNDSLQMHGLRKCLRSPGPSLL
jgi:hypothetical protein